jgi:beta-glucosidase
MSAFNDLNGVPASANPFTLSTVLRREWRFDGVVVSDYNSVTELINHRLAADAADAARQALASGVDMEMVSRSYATEGPRLVKEGRLPIEAVDEAVRRVLRMKIRAGIFEQPYADAAREKATIMRAEYRTAARRLAARSMVLLKNDRGTLPLAPAIARLAVIGPLADNRPEMMGNWTGDGKEADVVTVLQGIRAAVSPATAVTYAKGVDLDLEVLAAAPAGDAAADAAIDQAVKTASNADAIVLVIGETGAMSGEASSRASLELPGRQLDLAKRIVALNKPVAVVLMNGRPLAIEWLAEQAPAILEAWFPGTEAGNAVADVLFGRVNPGGKLPVTFPRATGQAPIYYNYKTTGRPPNEKEKYTSKYLDVPWTPLYPFGHGLSYTQFRISDARFSAPSVGPDGTATLTVTVENAGSRDGDEVVQVYVSDLVRSVTPPIQELKAFRRVPLKAGERRQIEFTLGPRELGFYNRDLKWIVEPGLFSVRVSNSSAGGVTVPLEVR